MSSGIPQGSSASNPIRLSESPELQHRSVRNPRAEHAKQVTCPWRSRQPDPDSCSRFCDCPSHTIKRDLSSDEDNDDRHVRHRRIQRRREQESSDSEAPGSTRHRLPTRALPRYPTTTSTRGSGTRTPQVFGTASNPIFVEDSPNEEARPSRSNRDYSISVGGAPLLSDWRRRSVFGPANSSTGDHTLAALSNRSPDRSVRRPGVSPRPIGNTSMAGLPAVSLPRWQPDAEVTYCPICHTQFSFFVRKHHCRKCGRVVCDACSPHRITIPYQYIVQPPGAPRVFPSEYPPSLIAGEGGYADFSVLGGGERVRLCNPCVPDPNTTPPQTQAQDPVASSSNHARSQSSINPPAPNHNNPLASRLSVYLGAQGTTLEQFARSRSVTMSNQSTPALPGQIPAPPRYDARRPVPPGRASASARPFQGPPAADPSPVLASGSVPGSSTSRTNRTLPPVPQPAARRQIAEEDECPVCHRELPARTLRDFEAQREAHITSCIMSHSSTPTRGGGTPTGGAGAAQAQASSSSRPRMTGMFPYKATEKDCVDSAECTICLEEFEVGVDMARLECLCRFHRRCINAWFERHPGQCPMHQHDGFGF